MLILIAAALNACAATVDLLGAFNAGSVLSFGNSDGSDFNDQTQVYVTFTQWHQAGQYKYEL
ncbi:MAG: hypothetical protein HUK40_11540 [Desulfobacter sp.]|nr:hypothetical protein [Desulfobacter sp.]WDP84468.1 MAG: hypothetical protein HUN05_04320 [Desulfobacter sp.]